MSRPPRGPLRAAAAQPPPAIGDRPVVRVVHPSGSVSPHVEALEAGLTRLEAAGCRIRWDDARARACWRGYLAGDDDARADELIAALTEPGVDIVWFARGGSGGARCAARVADAVRDAPARVVIGFSDATAYLGRLAERWVVFHGPVITSLAHPAIAVDLDALFAVLRGTSTTVPFAPRPETDAGVDPSAEVSEAIEGRLMGGNLTVLAASVGTPVAPRPAPGDIWLLEDVGEAPYRLDRAFWQLRASGLLDDAAAIWLGDLALGRDDDTTARAMIAQDAPCPVIAGAPAGHTGVLALLPLGGSGRLDPATQTFTATRPWVERR